MKTDKEARVDKSGKKPKTSKFSATKIHSNVRAASRDGSDVRGSEQHESRFGESSSLQVLQKTKPIAKQHTQSDYISFFKHHYRKLSNEHTRWTTSQITKVVKLLWKKSKSTKTLRRKDGRLRTSKPISGRRYFRKTKGLDARSTRFFWTRLPLESRKFWDNKAQDV